MPERRSQPICPLCQDTAEATLNLPGSTGGYRAARRVLCQTCGTYDLTDMMATNLKNLPVESRYSLSAITRTASDDGQPIELTTASESLIQETPQPDALERVAILLRLLIARSGGTGKPVVLDARRDYPVAYVYGEAGLAPILGDMVREGLVEQALVEGAVHYRVTMTGHRWLAEYSKNSTRADSATGWPKADRAITEARQRLRDAQNAEQFQAVGLLCRETLISVAQAVYDTSRHGTLDGKEASGSDAKRMLEAVIATELGGRANEEARAHAKSAVQLAVALQHDRAADFRDAALCVEATAFVARIIAIVVGKEA